MIAHAHKDPASWRLTTLSLVRGNTDYSQKIVCVHSTYKTHPYGFKLVTLVVPDEFKDVHQFLFKRVASYLSILLNYCTGGILIGL